jgi:hypothetical protein
MSAMMMIEEINVCFGFLLDAGDRFDDGTSYLPRAAKERRESDCEL